MSFSNHTGSSSYGAFVLNHRVVLHVIDATPPRWLEAFITRRSQVMVTTER